MNSLDITKFIAQHFPLPKGNRRFLQNNCTTIYSRYSAHATGKLDASQPQAVYFYPYSYRFILVGQDHLNVPYLDDALCATPLSTPAYPFLEGISNFLHEFGAIMQYLLQFVVQWVWSVHPSEFIKAFTLMQHEGSFHLTDIRHLQGEQALRTVFALMRQKRE